MEDNKILTDNQILDLYESRSESAISETAKRYGKYCVSIAANILRSREDADECVNDTYLHAWNAIPPNKPTVFSAFLGRITRNLALDRYKSNTAKKRGGDETALLLGELDECIPAPQNVEKQVESADLTEIVKDCLAGLKKEERIFFTLRYWYGDSAADIAEMFGVSAGKVGMSLNRTRSKLRTYLEERGVYNEN
ncbi:MAG: sigma-70 family RNA polymerase sigma factor [Oscillospiraceae bacterium]|nr:sigma-70 family RNA polymerase sigma factor [Oscillospiraceae bacterium]